MNNKCILIIIILISSILIGTIIGQSTYIYKLRQEIGIAESENAEIGRSLLEYKGIIEERNAEIEMFKGQISLQSEMDLFMFYSNKYDIDYCLTYAIAKHETGDFTSEAWLNKNNPAGIFINSKLHTFYSQDFGIHYMMVNLKKNYIDIGLNEIGEIGSKYAPIGINDNGTNKFWVPKVTEYYNECRGEIK